MLGKKLFSNVKRVYTCLLKAFKLHVKIEKIIYEYITEDEVKTQLFADEVKTQLFAGECEAQTFSDKNSEHVFTYEINKNLFFNENLKKYNKQMDNLIIQLYNQSLKN